MKTTVGVDPVQELGPEGVLQLAQHLLLHALVVRRRLGGLVWRAGAEPDARVLLQQLGADVAGHDDDRVAEVDPTALGIRQMPVLQDLEQDVEHLGVRLLDLIEQHHGVARRRTASVSWPPSS